MNKEDYEISFIDIDETLFRTFAKINVIKNGKLVKKLTNQEFNTYTLKEGESFDFGEFRDAKLFKETSIPIEKTITRVRKMISRIKETGSDSRIILLTARSDFLDKKTFLSTFYEHKIDVSDKNIIYIHRTGDKSGSIAEKKRKVIIEYLSCGKYRRCRMIDDDSENVKAFLKLGKELPKEIINKVKEKYKLDSKDKAIEFYALLVKEDGSLKRM